MRIYYCGRCQQIMSKLNVVERDGSVFFNYKCPDCGNRAIIDEKHSDWEYTVFDEYLFNSFDYEEFYEELKENEPKPPKPVYCKACGNKAYPSCTKDCSRYHG